MIYEDMLDALNLNSVANEFIQDSEYRTSVDYAFVHVAPMVDA